MRVTSTWSTLAQVDLLKGWTATQTATVGAAIIAVLGVTATLLTNSARARREHRADPYAQALSGVADYLEGPYRIRRKDGTPAHRNAITAALSDVKSSIDHRQQLLRLHTRKGVADAYDDYVMAAKVEAGRQMHDAWKLPAIASDAEVNLHESYDRAMSNRYRAYVVKVMQADLGRRWWNPLSFIRYAWRAHHRLDTPIQPATSPRTADQHSASTSGNAPLRSLPPHKPTTRSQR